MHENRTKKLLMLQDRFIPKRTQDSDILTLKLKQNGVNSKYHSNLENILFSESIEKNTVLNFSEKQKSKGTKLDFGLLRDNIRMNHEKQNKLKIRNIPLQPQRILAAQGLLDDFYLNLIDWSSKDILAVCLNSSVYLWNAQSNKIQLLMTCDDRRDFITSLSWEKNGVYLALGTSYNFVLIYDAIELRKMRIIDCHVARVGSICWNGNLLTSASRDGVIINHDLRHRDSIVDLVYGHTSDVCGLKWSPDFKHLASGGNDNILNIWDIHKFKKPKIVFDQHKAAVRAISWCPTNKNILASGGGTSDKTLRIWDISNSTCSNFTETNSQICSIAWSTYGDELVSTHGFSENQIIVWKYQNLQPIQKLPGHQARIIHMAQSPDGETICTGAGDETLRFWKIFEPKLKDNFDPLSIMNMDIR